jgi:hypothetical protein
MSFRIHDNVVASDLHHTTFKWLGVQTLLYGWKARKDSSGQFWHRNFVLPGKYEHRYDAPAVSAHMTFERFVAEGTPLSAVTKHMSDRFFDGKALTRVWVNAQTFGDEAAIHRDFPLTFRGNSRTVVWYPVPEWDSEWGGDFALFDDDKELIGSTLVKPNRAVVFDGTTLHAARPISRYCNALRVSVSFGLEVLND